MKAPRGTRRLTPLGSPGRVPAAARLSAWRRPLSFDGEPLARQRHTVIMLAGSLSFLDLPNISL
jgi:hypothetical protein